VAEKALPATPILPTLKHSKKPERLFDYSDTCIDGTYTVRGELQLCLWLAERLRILRRPFAYDFPLDLPAGRFGDFVDKLHRTSQQNNSK